MEQGMEYRLTDGNHKDFIILVDLLDKYLNHIVGGDKQREQYNQYNSLEDIHDVILLYDNDEPIGCAGFKHYAEGAAEVKRVFLREEYRGRGLAKDLMSRLEIRAKELGYRRLILETGRILQGAFGLYQRLGYGIIENYGPYCCMCESVCMGKEL